MEVYAFKGNKDRVFGFTKDIQGTNLPAQYQPWQPFKTLDLKRGEESTPGIRTGECLDDLDKYGFHVTEAHVRITETLI